jgi:uncharacterized protein (DUF1778 family)
MEAGYRPRQAISQKNARLEVRVSAEQRHLLGEAATVSGMTVSGFVLSHATAAARTVLADRVVFELPVERWNAFVDLLDRETRPMTGLAAFLARPSVLDEA